MREVRAAAAARAERRAHRRAVAHLDARLRKDIGLGEFGGDPAAPSWLDLERARW